MPARLTVTNNGPIKVEGEFSITDADGNTWDLGGKSSVWVCRCGQSKNIPFCDGSHKSCGFASPAKAG